MKAIFELGFSGPDVSKLAALIQAGGLPAAGLPEKLRSDGKERKVTADWLERWSTACKSDLMARWPASGWLRLDRAAMVKVSMDDFEVDSARTLELVRVLPFELGSNASLHPQWEDGSLGEKYLGRSFGDLHWPHGWACFFKGDGHRRLVSRRWLDFGPWHVVRAEDDVTMVQFHDLSADPVTALEQARLGHERMGISRTGGFLQTGFVYAHKLGGRYFAEKRRLDIVVNGREVMQSEMLDACAARHYQALGKDQPLDSVAFTFVREEEARAHLHELWLRELECWAIVKGREVRLDLDYHPDPQPPAWVLRVQAREGR